jgi:DNA-binding MarR family transcriptional regulator
MGASKRSAWYESVRGHAVLIELMDEDLRRDCGTPLVWYDVLVEIAHAPGHAIRMRDLAEQVVLSRSWLTRRVSQLEEAGLVQRLPDEIDGRGILAVLTELGRDRFEEMERSHSRSIGVHFSAHINEPEADVIATSFRRIADRARLARFDEPQDRETTADPVGARTRAAAGSR